MGRQFAFGARCDGECKELKKRASCGFTFETQPAQWNVSELYCLMDPSFKKNVILLDTILVGEKDLSYL